MMIPLHSWNVSVEEAIRIQENLRNRVILERTLSKIETIGGGDVSYSKNRDLLLGAIAVLSFPKMEIVDSGSAYGEVPFPYIPGLLSFREAPILIKAFEKLKMKPDVMIFDGQGIAHPRGLGLASHLGLWFDLPSIGCAKTPLLNQYKSPGPSRGDYELIWMEGRKVGAVLRTKGKVKPLFVSPGHRIDLHTSIEIILATSQKFRSPEPLRRAHQVSRLKPEKS